MIKFKIYLKKILRKNLFFYNLILFIYKILLFPKNLLYKSKISNLKKKSFNDFKNNNGLLKIEYEKIELKYKTLSKEDYFRLQVGSIFEKKFFKELFKKIKPGMKIYDVGASIGLYTLPFAKLVGQTGKVYAFEPENKSIENIKENLIINKINNVVLFPYALSEKTSKGNFYVRPDKVTHSLFEQTLAPSRTNEQIKLEVEIYSINDLILNQIAEKPNFIKIDTEGAELKILDGLKNNNFGIENIFVEIHPDALKLEKIFNPEEVVENKLKLLGFNKLEYFDKHHILASKN